MLVLLYIATAFAAWRAFRWLLLRRKLGSAPGPVVALVPATLIAEFLPSVGYNINIKSSGVASWTNRFAMYRRHNATCLSFSSPLYEKAVFYISDPLAVEKILLDRKNFGKPLEMYKLLAHQGQNVLITEGEEHRRHRKIAAPAFSEANTALVWQDTQDVAHEFFQSIDRQAETRTDGSRATTLDAPLTMLRVALHIIARAGFGHSSAYDDSAAPPPGHHYTFIEAVTVASEHALAKAFLPDFVYRLPFLPRKVKASLDKTWSAYDEFETYLSEMIEERVHSQEDKHDLFSLLVKDMAGDSEEDTGTKLSTREVKGNIFIMLLAGHETTANTLAFALGLLAMHPEEQDKLHAEASKLGDSPAYEEFTSLVRCQAVFNETLRLFPPVPGIPKYAVEDTFVPYHTIDTGEKRQMLIPKDSRIMVDEISLASNPDLWESPNEFKPDRFIDTPTYKWNRAAFMPFSGGVRSCIGQRFAQVEGAIMLALISKHYKLELQESDTARYRAGSESFESMQDRVLASDTYISLTPRNLKIVLVRR